MANQYDILPFLETLGTSNKKDPGFDGFIREMKIRKEKEQKKAEYIANAPIRKARRLEAASNFTFLLTIFAGILFFCGIVVVCWPFIRIGNFNLSDSMMLLFNPKRDILIVASTITFFCVLEHFHGGNNVGVSNVFSAIWSMAMQYFLTKAYIVQFRGFHNYELEFVRYSASLFFLFLLCNVYGSRLGDLLNRTVFLQDVRPGEKVRLGAGEVWFMILNLFSYGVGFFYIKRFCEDSGNANLNSNLFVLLPLWALPIIICVLYSSKRSHFCMATENLFCATMEVYYSVLVLLLFQYARGRGGMGILAWIGVLAIGIVICWVSLSGSDSDIPWLLIVMLLATLIIGTVYCLIETPNGIYKTFKWWIKVPMIYMTAVAVKNMFFNFARIRPLKYLDY